jgi:TonB family protein
MWFATIRDQPPQKGRCFYRNENQCPKGRTSNMRSIDSPRSLALVLFVACTVSVPLARAQSAAASSVGERTSRDASNPMRVILEAGKLKVRIKPEADASPPAAAPAPKPATVARPKPAQAAPPVVAAPATPPSAPADKAVARSTPPASTPAAPLVELPPPVIPVVEARAAPSAAPAVAAAARKPVALKNVTVVEPDFPNTVIRRLRSEVEIIVDLVVKPDGSVSDVVVRSTPFKGVEEPVVAAVRQWRYEPIAEARPHTVQLVLQPMR